MTEESEPEAGPLAMLLVLQAKDETLDQLSYRRRHLPEREAHRNVEHELTVLETRLGELEIERARLDGIQSALETQIEEISARVRTIDERLQAGVPSFRDQEAMAHELESLVRRRSECEDRELETMESLEPIEAAVYELQQARAEHEESAARIKGELALAEEAISSAMELDRVQRTAIAGRLPEDLLREYERIRQHLGGTGAAHVEHGACSGCRLALPSAELDRIRHAPAGSLFHCEQCGRILVLA